MQKDNQEALFQKNWGNIVPTKEFHYPKRVSIPFYLSIKREKKLHFIR
jgi:hypothetical protein